MSINGPERTEEFMKAPVFSPGCTRQPGKRHLHTDGIKNQSNLAAVVDFASRLGFPSETLIVQDCVANPNRTDITNPESHHELNAPGDLISTTLVEPFDIGLVNELVRFILSFSGVTVELEHVIGKVDSASSIWRDSQGFKPARLDLRGLKFTIPDHFPIEYHLAYDIRGGEVAPHLNILMTETLACGLMIGTWYNFGGWRLRSNRFARAEGIYELVEDDHDRFCRYCKAKDYRGETRVVAEWILGIWTSPW